MGLTSAAYLEQLQKLLPTGPAWLNKINPTSVLYKVLAGSVIEFSRIDARSGVLIEEVDPRTTYELLEDWERVAGLPTECAGLGDTIQTRRNQLVSVLTSRGGQSKAYYLALAAAAGFTITIDEFFTMTVDDDVDDSLYDETWAFTWRVNAPAVTVLDFRAGQSAAGERLRTWGNEVLECLINHYKPAHTNVLFAYA